MELTRKGNSILLRVKDNGKGLPDFAPNSMKGIGLNSIQNRVKLLGGTLKVTSAAGKGATFEIRCQV